MNSCIGREKNYLETIVSVNPSSVLLIAVLENNKLLRLERKKAMNLNRCKKNFKFLFYFEKIYIFAPQKGPVA